MIQVQYDKAAYQEAKRTPEKDRTEEQKMLAQIDFRQGPNPVLILSSGAMVVLRPGMLLEGDEDGNIGIVLNKAPEEKVQEEDTTEGNALEEEEKIPEDVDRVTVEDFLKDKKED